MARTLSLTVRNLVFTIVIPGLGGAWVPWSILTRHGRTPTPVAWEAVPVIAAGVALYLWCVWKFAAAAPSGSAGERDLGKAHRRVDRMRRAPAAALRWPAGPV